MMKDSLLNILILVPMPLLHKLTSIIVKKDTAVQNWLRAKQHWQTHETFQTTKLLTTAWDIKWKEEMWIRKVDRTELCPKIIITKWFQEAFLICRQPYKLRQRKEAATCRWRSIKHSSFHYWNLNQMSFQWIMSFKRWRVLTCQELMVNHWLANLFLIRIFRLRNLHKVNLPRFGNNNINLTKLAQVAPWT